MTSEEINEHFNPILDTLETKTNDISDIVSIAKLEGKMSRTTLTVLSNRVLAVALACQALDALLRLKEMDND